MDRTIGSLLFFSLLTITPALITALPNLPSTSLAERLSPRQNVAVPVSSSDSVPGQATNTLTIIIPIAVLGVISVAGLLIWAIRRRKHLNDPPPTTQVSGTGVTTAAQRRRRYLSRQESGTSVRSLPMYSREAGDQELVLARHSSRLAEEESRHSQDEPEGLAPPSSDAPRPSIDSVASDGSESSPLQRASTSASTTSRGPAPTYLEAMSSPQPTDRQAEEGQGGVPPPRQATVRERSQSGVRRLLSRAGLAKREDPIETLTPMSQLPSDPAARSSRNSSHSLLLHPTTSRYSTLTTGSARSSTDMSYTSPWSSSHSLHGVHISSPVPNSAVRASFEAPRGGLTEDQMRFLGSREAVNVAGVPLDANGRRRSRGLSLGERPTVEAPPPSFDEINGERSTPTAGEPTPSPSEPSSSGAPPPESEPTVEPTSPITTPSRQASSSSEATSHRPPSLMLNSLPAPEIEVQIATPAEETFPKAQ